MNYEEYFDAFRYVNRAFGDTIYRVMQESDLIMIHDVHLMLIPNSLFSRNSNSKVGIFFHMAFPSSDVLKTYPYFQELIKSILLCDVIGFHVFQFARNFLTICKRLFGIFYEIKLGGALTLNYLGRQIIVRILHGGIDIDYIKSVISGDEFASKMEKYQIYEQNDRFNLVSVDRPNYASGLLIKLVAYKKFLDKFTELKNKILLIQVIVYEKNEEIDELFEEQLNEAYEDIIKEYSSDVIIIEKVNKFTLSDRLSLFAVGSGLFYLQIREGCCTYINEYIAAQNLIQSSNFKFGIVLSESVGVSSSIKGAIRVNSFNINSIVSALERVYFMKEDERNYKFQKDLEIILQNTTFSWIKHFLMDLKRLTSNQTSIKIGIGIGLNFRLLKLNSNFQHLPKNELVESYIHSQKRLLFLDYEGTLQSTDNIDDNYHPTPRLLKILNALAKDKRNIVYIVAGRERKTIEKWFESIPNIGLAAEHGYFHKYPIDHPKYTNEWNELFQIKDWSWRESVLNILEGFTEKTEGSYITHKDTIITWWYKDCDIYFGHLQANEIITHLQNIFENNNIEIVNGRGYVEVKPRNVNKGYFLSHIIKNEFIDGNGPDFIFAIGDDTSDEEMFKYLSSVNNQLTYLKENIRVFTCTLGRKPSSAQYYLNEIHEVLEYLENLNQANNIMSYSNSKKKKTIKLHSDHLIFSAKRERKQESFYNLNVNMNI